ncbi:Transcription activator GLK1 [Vitis vinifera]|uniref:Transcription activator GLK1 n=1 Tax=Vitis vinifera TaxID=29760 RepID=A0A438JKN5_VITVI|nr:Transcription activator GLK1 [Vitis vinifera]
MLAVSPLRSTNDEREGEMESFSIGADDFPDFYEGNLLECIDFDDLFIGIHDGEILPDLEMDPEILAEFSVSAGEESDVNTSVTEKKVEDNPKKEEEDKVSGTGSGSGLGYGSSSSRGEEIVSKRSESVATNASPKEVEKGRKSSAQSKNPQGKRKVKVDWTPELHRRFVQAVEQLEFLLPVDLSFQFYKYRSHRKHLLAREAEAASWSQKRQMYGVAAGGGGHKREMGVDQSAMHMWPKHLPHSPSPPPPPPPTWPPSATPPSPSPDPYWHPHHQRVPNGLTQGTPCFPQPLAAARFATPPVTGIPPHPMYKVDHHHPGIGVQARHSGPFPLFDFHPSKETIDAAIGDALSKPWQPLPLGLKPPSLDGVMVELQRQGVPKIPPTCA